MKEYQFGNSTVIIHSPLAQMDKDEQKEWYKQEWERKNPVLRTIVDAVVACHLCKTDDKDVD
ncbi:hypothetical protein [Bacillus sp. FJAT-45350]|uniref:hypothetical protein n=1 Tax=Bacillus sp. FJAT-45350 TaxID=2011014 RepID=UPI000BB7C0FB|nr:hypothetical protein [Bacillus sp. FJAT-45350]